MLQARKETDLIVVHCSATKASQNWGRAEIDKSHRQRGFVMIGYHYVITRDGTVQIGRPVNTIGAHVEGHNANSIGICMVGGLADDGKHGEDNFTDDQFEALRELIRTLRKTFPKARICGHRDLSPDLNRDGKITRNEWMKECPSFDVAAFVSSHNI